MVDKTPMELDMWKLEAQATSTREKIGLKTKTGVQGNEDRDIVLT